MNTKIRLICLIAALIVSQLCLAQAPTGAPADATALCNDGTYFTGATKQGGCRGHQGIKTWYGDSAATPIPPRVAKSTPASTPVSPPAPAPKEANVPAPSNSRGAVEQVWLNTATNVYHCAGTQWYGKTKAGAYISEEQAKAKGARPDHGRPCK